MLKRERELIKAERGGDELLEREKRERERERERWIEREKESE